MAETIEFDIKLPRFQDWDWAIRASQKYKMKFLNEALSTDYFRDDNITLSKEKYYFAIDLIYEKYKEVIFKNEGLSRIWSRRIADSHFGLGKGTFREKMVAFRNSKKPKYLIKAVLCVFCR